MEAASLAEDGFFEAATAAPAAPALAAPAAASGLEAVFVCILHCLFLFSFFLTNQFSSLVKQRYSKREPNVSEIIVFVLVSRRFYNNI